MHANDSGRSLLVSTTNNKQSRVEIAVEIQYLLKVEIHFPELFPVSGELRKHILDGFSAGSYYGSLVNYLVCTLTAPC